MDKINSFSTLFAVVAAFFLQQQTKRVYKIALNKKKKFHSHLNF